MHVASEKSATFDRRIGVQIGEGSLAPHVDRAMHALGYDFYDAEEDLVYADRSTFPVWLADEERIDELPSASARPRARILAISRPGRETSDDPRIVARLDRSVRLTSLYETVQIHFERTPRRKPRVPTSLSARCIRDQGRSLGALLSLSEGGCLLHGDETLSEGVRVSLQFALPDYGLVSAEAECRYRLSGNCGMAFALPPEDVRQTIAHYVTLRLAASASATPPPSAIEPATA
ncbi:MAG: PilZ domain-containing protein [Deltaproteobacteria bacterium]|jgi:hypothetical protein|nr:PilZ domain-containing protein [Deltaproteobacteria bacterium]MBW2499372.1 PilZ domain-containing protein [Deltaproteobacteria bacterium]